MSNVQFVQTGPSRGEAYAGVLHDLLVDTPRAQQAAKTQTQTAEQTRRDKLVTEYMKITDPQQRKAGARMLREMGINVPEEPTPEPTAEELLGTESQNYLRDAIKRGQDPKMALGGTAAADQATLPTGGAFPMVNVPMGHVPSPYDRVFAASTARAVAKTPMSDAERATAETQAVGGTAALTRSNAIATKREMTAEEQQKANQDTRDYSTIKLPESKATVREKNATAEERVAQAAATRSKATSGGDPKDIAAAIMRGDQPPVITGLTRQGATEVRGELARAKYNLSRATQDWTSTQKYLQTLNGAQQTRLRQAVDFADESLGIVEGLAKEWDAGGFPVLNKARLAGAKQGAFGPEAQKIATKLENQIADMQSELAVVYRGGNSPTDEAMKKASSMLQSSWSKETLFANVDLIRQNLGVRRNSMKTAGVVTNSGNAYAPDLGASGGNQATHQAEPVQPASSGAQRAYKQIGMVHLSDGRTVRGGTNDGKTFFDLQTGAPIQ